RRSGQIDRTPDRSQTGATSGEPSSATLTQAHVGPMDVADTALGGNSTAAGFADRKLGLPGRTPNPSAALHDDRAGSGERGTQQRGTPSGHGEVGHDRAEGAGVAAVTAGEPATGESRGARSGIDSERAEHGARAAPRAPVVGQHSAGTARSELATSAEDPAGL